MPLYHYTSKKKARKILASGVIKAKHPHGNLDRKKAVYLTEFSPSNHTPSELVANNYDDNSFVNENYEKALAKTAVAFKFSKSKLPKAKQNFNTKKNRNEWIVRHDISLDLCTEVIGLGKKIYPAKEKKQKRSDMLLLACALSRTSLYDTNRPLTSNLSSSSYSSLSSDWSTPNYSSLSSDWFS